MGLDERAADAAVAAAERACLAAGVAIRAATAVAARLRAFFVLLLRTQRVLAGENPDGGGAAGDEQNLLPAANPALVREFLQDGIRVDRLGEQLSAGVGGGGRAEGRARGAAADAGVATGGEGADTGGGRRVDAAREAFLASVRGAAAAAGFGAPDMIHGLDAAAGSGGKLPLLWRAARELKGACLTALDAPAAAVSRSFRWSRAFPLVSAGVDAQGNHTVAPRVSHGGGGEDGTVSRYLARRPISSTIRPRP